MNSITLDDLSKLESRDGIGELLNAFALTGRAAEIGVMWGDFASIVLKNWVGNVYYCVDVWERQSAAVYKERTDDIDYEKCFHHVFEWSKQEDRICIIRKDSVKAARYIVDQSLDFVFIDANHSLDAVLRDMDAWFPKVKSGGVFAGHDYGDDTNWPHWCEVKSAVDEWMRKNNMQFVTDKKGNSWYSVKP